MNALTPIGQDDQLTNSASLSLRLPDGLAFERWQEIGRELAAREKVLNWWIGDWWAFGEHRYGDRAKVAAEGVFGLEFQTLRNIASVCRAIDASRRRDVLPWSHHAEVAALARHDPEAAMRILDRAEREGMTKAEVRAEVRALKAARRDEVLSARGEDPDYYAVLTVTRAWNRLLEHQREMVRELMLEAFANGNGDIDP